MSLDREFAGLGYRSAPARRETWTTDEHGFTVAVPAAPPEPIDHLPDMAGFDIDTWWAQVSGDEGLPLR